MTAVYHEAPVTGARMAPRETHPQVANIALAALRVVVGWTFLWAFLDKTFGLGFATPAERAWLEGGSPTEGFLTNAPAGPFKGLYNGIAADAWADWLFMVGLLGIGVALIAGVFMRLATVTGVLLYLLMWTAVLPPENNPVTDDHIIGALAVFVLGAAGAGRVYGLGPMWENLPVVRRFPILR